MKCGVREHLIALFGGNKKTKLYTRYNALISIHSFSGYAVV